MKKHVPHYRQLSDFSCGAAALRMVFAAFGIRASEKALAAALGTNARTGTSRKALAKIAATRGLRAHARHRRTLADVARDLAARRPVIVLYREPDDDTSHYAVCVAVSPRRVTLHDPWHGPSFSLPRREFLRRWHGTHRSYPHWAMTFPEVPARRRRA